jgi:DNA-binding NarL/FixJ family response regulator
LPTTAAVSADAGVSIADNQEYTHKTLKLLIEPCPGWEICGEAASGEQAIQKASELNPDLVVLDLRMPVADGLQAARATSKAMPTVPILIYKLFVSRELAVEAKKAGVRQIVDKAGTRGKLLTAMRVLLTTSGVPANGAGDGVLRG